MKDGCPNPAPGKKPAPDDLAYTADETDSADLGSEYDGELDALLAAEEQLPDPRDAAGARAETWATTPVPSAMSLPPASVIRSQNTTGTLTRSSPTKTPPSNPEPGRKPAPAPGTTPTAKHGGPAWTPSTTSENNLPRPLPSRRPPARTHRVRQTDDVSSPIRAL